MINISFLLTLTLLFIVSCNEQKISTVDGNILNNSAVTTTTSSPTPPVVIPTGQIAAFNFNEGSGTTLTDSSSYNSNLTTNGGSWNASGHTGNSYTFDGSSWAQGGNDLAQFTALTYSYTLMAWVYPTVDPGADAIVIGFYDPGWNRPLFLKAFDYGHSAGYPGCAYNDTWQESAVGTSKLSLNTWTHVACTTDGITSSIYINGVLAGTTTISSYGQMSIVSPGSLVIGSFGSAINFPYTGRVDDVRFFNQKLNAADVVNMMNTAVQ